MKTANHQHYSNISQTILSLIIPTTYSQKGCCDGGLSVGVRCKVYKGLSIIMLLLIAVVIKVVAGRKRGCGDNNIVTLCKQWVYHVCGGSSDNKHPTPPSKLILRTQAAHIMWLSKKSQFFQNSKGAIC